jgi:hypothetical protein
VNQLPRTKIHWLEDILRFSACLGEKCNLTAAAEWCVTHQIGYLFQLVPFQNECFESAISGRNFGSEMAIRED